jgi:hypothetical protein
MAGAAALGLIAVPVQAAPAGGSLDSVKTAAPQAAGVQKATWWRERRYHYRPYSYGYGPRYRYRHYGYRPGFRFYYGPRYHHRHWHNRHW